MLKRIALIILSLLLLLPALTVGEQTDERQKGVLPCSFLAPEEILPYAEQHLSDGDAFTTVTLHKGETLTMQFSGGAPIGLYFDFYEVPTPFDLKFLDAEGAVLSAQSIKQADYLEWLPIEQESVAAVSLIPTVKDLVLSDWYACTADFELPFPDTGTHADALVILDLPGEELEMLGGLLAMLAGEHGLSVQVMYITQTTGYVAHQCMQVLSGMGITRKPIFGSARYLNLRGTVDVLNLLGGEITVKKRFTQLIRTMTPDLILTLDQEPSDERFQRSVVSKTVLSAVTLSANADKYPEWQAHTVKKVYTLSPNGETAIALTAPLYAYGGMPANQLADMLYSYYRENRVFRRHMPESVSFTLAQSTVGEDAGRSDLLEHLPTDLFAGYRVPTPEPTATPEPTETPTPAPTAAPTEEPTPKPIEAEVTTLPADTPAPESASPDRAGTLLAWLPASVGLLLSVLLWFLLRRSANKKLALLALLPILIGAAITVFALAGILPIGQNAADRNAEALPVETPAPTGIPTAEPTPAPTETPTPEPTEEPTTEPTEAPTPLPDPNDAYFLSGDGEEFDLDFEGGHWWYKNSVLSIDVHEVHTQYKDRGPLVYYIADIRMRDYTSYRSGLKVNYVPPWRFAREDGAVLAITGDCLINEKEQKGCLIRKGVFYANAKHADALIIEEDMSMRVMNRDTLSVRVLMDHGVRDTYSFGPILVENGEICEGTKHHRVTHSNPRAGIGMVEPGHWIAIVTDGRQLGYSMSIDLDDFAQMFADSGCTVAFNMDGGSSAGIVFMGEMLNKHYMPHTEDIQRPWIDALEFGYSEHLPSPTEPTIHDGYRH